MFFRIWQMFLFWTGLSQTTDIFHKPTKGCRNSANLNYWINDNRAGEKRAQKWAQRVKKGAEATKEKLELKRKRKKEKKLKRKSTIFLNVDFSSVFSLFNGYL